MSLFIAAVSILKVFSVSLGVGASTLAITNFFVAIADGYIDENERRMLGIVYVILRIAMVVLLLTSGILFAHEYSSVGLTHIPVFLFAQMIVLFVLFLNALLMSAELVPTTVGPALQAGSWYALGTITALQTLGYTNFTLLQFILGYTAWLILAIGIVNGIMAMIKK